MHSTSIFAVLGFASFSAAHMLMNTPVPYGKSSLTNGPLAADGSDFPCKQRSGVYDAEGANNVMPLGSSQKLAFTGSATHGGGSCQISITYDLEPTKNSVFKVIHSIEGGCPIRNVAGNNGDDAYKINPDTYTFSIPSDLPAGSATLAWTWFNKIGNREMYMNCAPVTLTGSKSKRGDIDALVARNATQLMERDIAAFNDLPNMFVANIGTGCGTTETKDLEFPNPGDSLQREGIQASKDFAGPTGSCQGRKAAAAAPTSVSAPSANPVLPGGVFATVVPSAPSPPAQVAAPPANKPDPPAPIQNAPSPPAANPALPASLNSPDSTGAFAAGSACTPEGLWNCIGGTSFQQCGSGTWSAVQQLAAGTKCTVGQEANINIVSSTKKRAVRFSNEHIHRHIHRSS